MTYTQRLGTAQKHANTHNKTHTHSKRVGEERDWEELVYIKDDAELEDGMTKLGDRRRIGLHEVAGMERGFVVQLV